MTKLTLTSALGALLLSFTMHTDFLTEQKAFERVRATINEKQSLLEATLKEHKISFDNLHLLFVAYKNDDVLEVYAKTKQETTYKKLVSYDICSRSGQPGPKRMEGDEQVPEGFYHIDRFNPMSKFYLSLGLNYPNLSDKRKSNAHNLGGDIFIHGSCVTIGCLPMTDTHIKEIYLLAVHAKNNGQSKIPVYIFPFKMTDQNMATYKARYIDNKELTLFWENLKPGYDRFTKYHRELDIDVAENGDYKY
jgi:murein L,D-transpeptidase YafK